MFGGSLFGGTPPGFSDRSHPSNGSLGNWEFQRRAPMNGMDWKQVQNMNLSGFNQTNDAFVDAFGHPGGQGYDPEKFVTNLYEHYLGRSPDDAGYDFWVDKAKKARENSMTEGHADYGNNWMEDYGAHFLASNEYAGRDWEEPGDNFGVAPAYDPEVDYRGAPSAGLVRNSGMDHDPNLGFAARASAEGVREENRNYMASLNKMPFTSDSSKFYPDENYMKNYLYPPRSDTANKSEPWGGGVNADDNFGISGGPAGASGGGSYSDSALTYAPQNNTGDPALGKAIDDSREVAGLPPLNPAPYGTGGSGEESDFMKALSGYMRGDVIDPDRDVSKLSDYNNFVLNYLAHDEPYNNDAKELEDLTTNERWILRKEN